MGNRGQKRTEMVDELPADKRACSSLDFRPSSSNSSVQTHMNSTHSIHETHDNDMDTSSSASASSRSEGEPERDSAYGSCDSDDAGQRRNNLRDYRDYQRQRSSGDHGKFKRILTSLSEESEPSGQLAALTELCEVLSFCTEDSLSSMISDSLAPLLVKYAKHESNPDIMLLAIRAITYICDVYPRSSNFLIRHDAVPALCRLMAFEYVDVAEQCLQALEKISREQPLACLQAGAIMAVLNFIEFFPTSVQRVALSTVVNICKKLPSESPSRYMEAVPILCNLLQHEDRQLVEYVAICLIKIVEQVSQSSEMLDELCKNALIGQIVHLLDLNSRTTVSRPIYNGLIGILVKLSSGSIVAFKALYELNISTILKDILSTYDLSHGMSSPHTVDGQCNQVYEVLKLLNELLPTSARDLDAQQVSDKEAFLVNCPSLLQKFGMDILPLLIQVVNSGANLYVCYGCLSVVNKLVYLSKSDMLLELLKNANISSFLAGVFTRKDQHVLLVALQIAEMILQKLSDIFLNSFIKEGIFFAIDALLTQENCSQLMFPVFSGIQLPFESSQKLASKEVLRCLCYAFATGQSATASETGSCKLEKDSVHNLAKHIKTNYFAPKLYDSEKGVTDILQKLRTLSTTLSDLVNMTISNDVPAQPEERFYCILHQIMANLNGRETISTFEFIESGIMRSLLNYLSNSQYLREKCEGQGVNGHFFVVEKRFEVFTRLFLSSSEPHSVDLPLVVLIQKLQSALSSLENFPVILSHGSKQRNSYAMIPSGRRTLHPCLKVRFVRGDVETCLCDYSEDVQTVDPFCSLDAIEGYLWPKVSIKRNEHIESSSCAMGQTDSLPPDLPSNASAGPGESLPHMEHDSMSTDLPNTQEDDAKLSQSAPEEAVTEPVEQELHIPSDPDTNKEIQHPASCSDEDASPKLVFYLEEQQLDRTLTLYQTILHQQIKENEFITCSKLWSQVYTLTYKRAVEPIQNNSQECIPSEKNFFVPDNVRAYMQYTPFFSSMFACELTSDLERSSSTYDILFLLKSLEGLARNAFHLMSRERVCAFAEGKIDNLDGLKVVVPSVPQNEFVSNKLTEKLEQQMRDSLSVSTGGMPSWCKQLMASCPFLFSFEARCKYFRLAAFGQLQIQSHQLSHSNSGPTSDRRPSSSSLPRKKFLVFRNQILDSAAQMMDLHARHKVLIEVEYNEEVGTGLGPTLEFYTLVSHEFQKSGLVMWREDHSSFASRTSLQAEDVAILMSPSGLFPCPWPSSLNTSDDRFSEVLKKFVLLGQVVAKSLQDGRVLDLHFSKAFYKLIIGQELTLYDIQSFDPELGRTLLEFQALVNRKKFLESVREENSPPEFDSCFRNTRIEDLFLDFTLPGYPDYVLTSGADHKMVDMSNLEEYISLVVDATINSGISRQVEAFKSGFNQVFPIEHLQIFTEKELERLLCGEHDSWAFNELLDHIKFDHGYTSSSPPVVNLLEIIQEFDHGQRRAFLQFVTGAPRLPPGGLASLNPKLTIVRKHCGNWADIDLPSVMTCANYLKLPAYSSKEKMREKLLYAITEGQGSFHLS
ncbi:E3 ubiquitin-protein ligase UPL4 isoform X2 [Quercus robur]|uniref:E3 ubiquitin-protein ligase UPL4 isoform X2 n=1 Tax=Quercus robur TaxID=38942 RepID=UPI0021634FFD|nr:E3 ubiquitin-protein ligase UPL4 isoform X2 [Quercus robur]